MSGPRVHRGNPSLREFTPSSNLNRGGGRGMAAERSSSSYGSHGGGSSSRTWGMPDGPGQRGVGGANKPPIHNHSSFSSYGSGASSPWSTPSGGGIQSRYGKQQRDRGGGGGGGGGGSGSTARALFSHGGSGSGGNSSFHVRQSSTSSQDERFSGKSSPTNWEEHASPSLSPQPRHRAPSTSDGAGSDLGSSPPESWEQYMNTTIHKPSSGKLRTSVTLTPFDSPALRATPAPPSTNTANELPIEKLELDSTQQGDQTTETTQAARPKEEISVHMLSLLYDPPVQGCEIKPYVSIVDGEGRVSTVPVEPTLNKTDAPVHFSWSRGQKRVCGNGSCKKSAVMQCLTCTKLSPNAVPQQMSWFCSAQCMRESWPQHRAFHAQKAKNETVEWNHDEDDVEGSGEADSVSQLYCKYPGVLHNTWQKTSNERTYTPTAEDVGRALRLECAPILNQTKKDDTTDASSATATTPPSNDLQLGTAVHIDTGAVIPAPPPPPPRNFLYADPTTPINTSNTFKTVCYNVLAQIYCTKQVHPYTPVHAMQWEYRRNLLLREILSHHADIICLQEVQSNHFDAFFRPQLSKHGYDGIFKRKTRDGGSDLAGNAMIDGCATFFKRDRFALMEQYGIEYNQAAQQHTANRQQLRRLMRGNIALVLVLEELPPPSTTSGQPPRRHRKRHLCVTNTHIFWDPEYPDVKLWQTWILCQELEKLVLPRNLPLVLCGDFNSMVESSVYELLATERVEQGEDVFGPTGDPLRLLPPPPQVSHRLPLLSAYATVGEPKFTNYTAGFIGVLDYVWFTRTHLRCVACLDIDDESLLRQHTALPSPIYPSDHIALVTILEFMD